MKKTRIIYLFSAIALLLASCNLSDFQFNKLTDPSGLSPIIYRPVSSGSYIVKDYTVFPWVGNTIVPVDSLKFRMITYPLDSMNFNTSGTDSMVIIIKTTNETPMRYRYVLSFTGTSMDSRVYSKYLNGAIINSQGDIIEASNDSIEYKLNAQDVKNLSIAPEMDLAITLYQPLQGPVLANVLKFAPISFKIAFRAPINLFKSQL